MPEEPESYQVRSMRERGQVVRAVVDRVQKPYAEDRDGNPIYMSVDVLECGHRLPTPERRTKLYEGGERMHEVRQSRRCRSCEREGAP